MKLTLKACRVNCQATAKELAGYVGVSEDTVYNWESGKYSPKAKQMNRILDFFKLKGFDVSYDNIKFE